MATPRRRSARLSRKSSTPERSAIRKTASTYPKLGSLVERDETPESGSRPTIDQVLSTPNDAPESSLRDRTAQLSTMKTPKTLPRPAHTEMNPKSAHQTTTDPPDTGFKLGFTDVATSTRRSFASVQNSPTKSQPRQSLPQHLNSPSFDFKFATESTLSEAAQKLMENVRDEAARIKAQMIAEKNEQDRKDVDAEQLFAGFSGAGRKMAKPKGKAGRFSDVHMAEFKKMDSIANHPSSFRAQPGFAQPTAQSLKRSGSRAGLDDLERPRTAGKGTPGKPAPSFIRPASASPFKSKAITKLDSDTLGKPNSAKRMRQSEFGDVSNGKTFLSGMPDNSSKPSGLPRANSMKSASVFSPTKASLARSVSTKLTTMSTERKSSLPRSNSVRSLKSAFEAVRTEAAPTPSSPTPGSVLTIPASKLPRSQSMKLMRPLPPLPSSATTVPPREDNATRSPTTDNVPSVTSKRGALSSRLPTFAGLKSILRPSRAPATKTTSTLPVDLAGRTPKQTSTAFPGSGSAKKVDFTPSTKSRYAVKLAAATPSPSKMSHVGDAAAITTGVDVFDPAAYTTDEDDVEDEDWTDAESEIPYPTLPSSSSTSTMIPGPSVKTFAEKAKQHNRRESKEFKSIFTTLEHPSRSKPAVTLTDVNTKVNQTDPTTHANIVTRSPSNPNLIKPSPSTIRRVRTSGVTTQVQPFEDTIKTVPHGLPGKKRRRESDKEDDRHDKHEDSKENRKLSVLPLVPGGWDEADRNSQDVNEKDEGEKRGGKRARVGEVESDNLHKKVEVKKPNAAREAAAKNAKERKGKSKGQGILSLSRLNMLARPKERK